MYNLQVFQYSESNVFYELQSSLRSKYEEKKHYFL